MMMLRRPFNMRNPSTDEERIDANITQKKDGSNRAYLHQNDEIDPHCFDAVIKVIS